MKNKIIALALAAICFGSAAAPNVMPAQVIAADSDTAQTVKNMTLDDVQELAKKGGRKCGTPFDMLAYIYEIDESYYLFVSGTVDGAPDKVQLCLYNEHISVDVLTGDVEAFIAEYTNYELPDIGYTFDEIYNMTEDEVRTVFNEKGLTDTEKYHIYPQRNGNTAVDNDSMTILLYPENYMLNLTDHELVSHVTDMNDRDKLFKDSDIVWDSEKVRKSLGLPKEYFNVEDVSSMGVTKSAPEGEDPDIRKCCQCSIRCKSEDKDKIADLRRAALNYIQLNPDFALVYHETSGGKNDTGETNENTNLRTFTVLDIYDTYVIVSVDGSRFFRELMFLYKKDIDSNIDPVPGMKLTLGYTGILETYPGQFTGVHDVKVVSENAGLIKGDSNCDGQVDMADVVFIMQALANPNRYGEKAEEYMGIIALGKLNADMNGDGLTVGDALTIQKKLLGYDISEILGVDRSAVAGKKFYYEKEGFGGYCHIEFNEDGSFLYSPGVLSSYLGGGTWKISGDTVILTEKNEGEGKTITNRFKIAGNDIVYIADGSDGLRYMEVKDGEKFSITAADTSDLEIIRQQLSDFFTAEKIDYSVIPRDKMPEQFADKYVFIQVNTADTSYAARYGAFLKSSDIDSSLIKSIPYKIDSDTELNKIRALLYCYILENNINASIDPTDEEADLKNKTVLVKYADSEKTRTQLENFLKEKNIDLKLVEFFAVE